VLLLIVNIRFRILYFFISRVFSCVKEHGRKCFCYKENEGTNGHLPCVETGLGSFKYYCCDHAWQKDSRLVRIIAYDVDVPDWVNGCCWGVGYFLRRTSTLGSSTAQACSRFSFQYVGSDNNVGDGLDNQDGSNDDDHDESVKEMNDDFDKSSIRQGYR
jgi:hypothetical protein